MVDYLDVTLNLNDGTYCPFHKPNEETTYIHVESDHSPQIIKKIPRSIEKRLSRLSSTKQIFENSEGYYDQRLRQCGYNEKLSYTKENNEINQKSRKRNIRWFNPPYSKSVKTNIDKLFLRLTNKHFPPTHKYRKIFNRKTIKISYSCMPNIKSKISIHNKIILNKPVNQTTRKCNCINKNTCPLNGNCLLQNILYIATIKSNKKNYQPRNYKGIRENTFKERYADHKRSFNINRYKNDTKLSVEHWDVKAGNSNPKVTWAVKNQFSAYNLQSNRCSLCLNE